MFFFIYNTSDYKALLHRYAKAMGTTVSEDGTLYFPEEYATGYLKTILLPNQLQAILFDYTLNSDIFLKRAKSYEEYYILNFEEIFITADTNVPLESTSSATDAHPRSNALLSSSLFDFLYMGKTGTRARGINILITPRFMATYLDIRLTDKVIEKYIALKTASINLEPLDTHYRHLVNEALEENKLYNKMKMVIIQNRILLLVERFFTRLYKKIELTPEKKRIKDEDIKGLMNAEALLVKDFSKPPPSVRALARSAMMSETKLKTLFKDVYNYSPYNYYQKSRMLRAKYLLNTKKYSIKEVGFQLGFQNLSNFTIAYKKEFNMLPSEVKK